MLVIIGCQYYGLGQKAEMCCVVLPKKQSRRGKPLSITVTNLDNVFLDVIVIDNFRLEIAVA